MGCTPKFSPAPWAWEGPSDNIHVVQVGQPNMRVCFLTSNGPTEANANLIASSPDMYAALKAVLPLLQAMDSEDQRKAEAKGCGLGYRGLPALTLVEAAINKAEGWE